MYAHSSLKRTSGPGDVSPFEDVVTVAELKEHCRIDTTEEDAYLEALIQAAREYCEDWTARAFQTQVWVAKYRGFPCEEILLPRPPLSAVQSIQYVDTAGATQTLSTDVYTVDANALPGRVLLVYGQSWPATRAQENAVTITFTAGYGDNADAVPATLRQAVKILAAQWYERREAVEVGAVTVSVLPFTVESLLSMHRMRAF